jgi:uncharacterized protein (TIGR03435 family)
MGFARRAALAFSAMTLVVQAQAPAKFEVASIKPCDERDAAPAGKRQGAQGNSPATLRVDCATVMDLVKQAYVLFANGRLNPLARVPVEGGPAWIQSARYRIEAKPAAPQNEGIMRGPMLQRLLEDRFQLKIHRETREVPAYALTVAKGGPKLHPFEEGSCTPLDLRILDQFPPPPFPELPPRQQYCGGVHPDGSRWIFASGRMDGPNITLVARALTIDEFIKHSLGRSVNRPVINQTGITGRFDYQLEFAPEAAESIDAAAPDTTGPSIFAAVQRQLGLKLEPTKGLGEFLVIDRVAQPSAN